MKKYNFKKYLWLICGLAIIFAMGFYVTRLLSNNAKKNFNTNFESLVETYLAGMNPLRIANLEGTTRDKESLDYLRLREQLSKMELAGKDLGIRWLYTMRPIEDKIVFLVDSVPERQFGHSEPGDIYKNIPESMQKAIVGAWQKGSTGITGQYTDDWGNFLSIVMPIKDFENGQIYGLLGVDIDYVYFEKEILNDRLPGIIGTILVAVIFVILFFFFYSSKTAQILINEEKEKFKAITESAKDAIVVMDGQGKVTFWNNGAENMFGYKQGEILGLILHDFITAKKEHQNNKNILHFGQTGQAAVLGKSVELPVRKKDGSNFFVELTVSRLKLDNRWYAVGIMRDITEKKKSTDKLKKHSEELERLNRLMIDRELKMVELKKELIKLKNAN